MYCYSIVSRLQITVPFPILFHYLKLISFIYKYRIYDWEPLNCQYNGLYHPGPRGIGAPCNETYFGIFPNPVDNGLALKMNLFAGDLGKDSSDAAQGIAKCPTTRLSTACNLLGQCIDAFPESENPYVIEFEFMLTNVPTGFDFCFMDVKGPNLGLCFTGGKYWITNINVGDQPHYKNIKALPTPASILNELYVWNTWRVEFKISLKTGYWNVYKNNVLLGGISLAAWKPPIASLTPMGSDRRFEIGAFSVMGSEYPVGSTGPNTCLTADMEYYVRNIFAVNGTAIDRTLLAKNPVTMPAPTKGAVTQTIKEDLSLYPKFGIYPTKEAKAAPYTTEIKTTVKPSGKVVPTAQQIQVSGTTTAALSGFSVLSTLLVLLFVRYNRNDD